MKYDDTRNINTRYENKLTVFESRLHKLTKSIAQCVRFFNKITMHIQNVPFTSL